MTPSIRAVIRCMSAARDGSRCDGEEGFLDDMRTASVVRTVAIAWSPAARMVSPDSNNNKKNMMTRRGVGDKSKGFDESNVRTDKINCDNAQRRNVN